MTGLRLSGCRATPLGSYLKALGVLRLLGEQVDSTVTGHWEAGAFVLSHGPGPDELVEFFVRRYQPTPLVSPWNGGSGFGPKDQQAGIATIEASTTLRLEPYRRVIDIGRRLRADDRWETWKKEEQVQFCRGALPDEVVAWIDATVVLTGDWREFPPLLGTGGNVGRLEFSNNFMQRVVDVLGLGSGRGASTPKDSDAWARSSLFAAGSPKLADAPIGQFDPGAAGGINSSPLGAAPSLVNPWDYVLLLEGALLFASGAARRLGLPGRGRAAMPFMVDSSPVGYATGTDAENAKGELWAPLWSRPSSPAEISRLIGEGRSVWGRGQARNGLDFARAVASLGVDRGIDEFVRHAFVERMGQSMLAVPVGRIKVRSQAAVPVLGQLDPWIERVQRARNRPAVVEAALRRVVAGQFDVATGSSSEALQRILVAVADLEEAIARSPGMREEAVGRPVHGLSAARWLPLLEDGAPEMRLAGALASLRDRLPTGRPLSDADRRASALALLLRPVRLTPRRDLEWSGQPPRVTGLGSRHLVDVLAAALGRRTIDVASRQELDEAPDSDTPRQTGVQPAFTARPLRARQAEVARLVTGDLDLGLLTDLLRALLLLDWRSSDLLGLATTVDADAPPPPPAWALLAPFFHGRAVRPENGGGPILLRPAAAWPRLLLAGAVADVVADALLRLRIAGLRPAGFDVPSVAHGVDGAALAAALLVPLHPGDVAALLARSVPSLSDRPDLEE